MERLNLKTHRRTELIEITDKIQAVVSKSKITDGFCIIFVPHTTAGLTINENADPSVKQDILDTLNKSIPLNGGYSHTEGNADAHIKSSILGVSLTVFIKDARLCLGTWQGIFFVEGDGPRMREVWMKLVNSRQ